MSENHNQVGHAIWPGDLASRFSFDPLSVGLDDTWMTLQKLIRVIASTAEDIPVCKLLMYSNPHHPYIFVLI